MTIYIDNTNVIRITNAVSTALDGTETALTADGVYTLYDSSGAEVAGQVWPASLTLVSPGSYAGYLESDLVLNRNSVYRLSIDIGVDVLSSASWDVDIKPEQRNS